MAIDYEISREIIDIECLRRFLSVIVKSNELKFFSIPQFIDLLIGLAAIIKIDRKNNQNFSASALKLGNSTRQGAHQ